MQTHTEFCLNNAEEIDRIGAELVKLCRELEEVETRLADAIQRTDDALTTLINEVRV